MEPSEYQLRVLLNIFQHIEWQTNYPALSTSSAKVEKSWNKVPRLEGCTLCAQGLCEKLYSSVPS